MRKKCFEHRMIEICSVRDIPFDISLSDSEHEYIFNNGSLIICVDECAVSVTEKSNSIIFYHDQYKVRIRENAKGFELKFDVTVGEEVRKIKLFIVGGKPIPRHIKHRDDPLDILKDNEGVWINVTELSYLSRMPRGGISYFIDDPHVQARTSYSPGKTTREYRYVSGDSQKDSEDTSELE